ncbi:protein NUCLEAR FUSION DEFECTIVE 4-like [Aristolochia californica]|uniref:protein NUCLEAR FUSION DEFECTIVE 4-like n=1 Tax=Aristolochia californica TaxID=171875 RepID=UPI0035D5EE65
MMGLFSPSSLTGKWMGFVTAVWVQSISGNNYTFPNYSNALKSLMGLTQLQLNNLSTVKDGGKAFGILAGLASDRVPTAVILLIGSIEGLIGYGAQWLVVSHRIRPLPYWQMCIFVCMGGNSTTWMNTAVLVTCMRNFQNNRGPVSGILKGFVGLSTAIFTDLCTALFSKSPSSFLLMLAVIPAVICLTSMVFLHEVDPAAVETAEEREESRYFAFFNVAAVVVAVYLLLFDVTGKHGPVLYRAFAAVLLALLASPLCVPIYTAIKFPQTRGKTTDLEGKGIEVVPVSPTQQSVGSKQEQQKGGRAAKKKPDIGEDHKLLEAARTFDFWILFLSFLCGVGTGMAVINNLGQIGLALGYADVSIFVSLTSIWGFFGRIGSGWISEYFMKKAATPRPVWNAASQILMAVGFIVMAMALPGSLYIGSILIGIGYGVRLAVTVPVASELFGLKYYGLLYNILILNLPLGSFLFSGLLAGFLYDAQATRTAAGSNTCIGGHCYRLVFIIMTVVCFVGLGLDVLLAFRMRDLYYKIRMRTKPNEETTEDTKS